VSRPSYRWLLIAISSLAFGSTIATVEKLITKRIDSSLPDSSQVLEFSRAGTLTFLSSKGRVIQKIGPATREKINLEEVPFYIIDAFLAAEDRRFYKHKGIDIWSISRALLTNLHQRSIQEGASTITQQLARIVFLSQDKSFTRKIKEAALALKLERQLNKKEILEHYLNNVYLGSSAYGIADASWVYFSKRPYQLNLQEAALIAGLAPAPSLYSPLVNPHLAIKRRSIVLRKMEREKFISQEEFITALTSPLKLNPATPKYLNSNAPFFTNWVYQELPFLVSKEQLEVGGLIVRTSINLEWQSIAQQLIQENSQEGLQGAIVSIEPNTGLIRVLVGGKDFETNQFNRATQALRSPGSTFKLFTYAAALKKGFNPKDIFIDSPKCWDDYCPKNFGNKYLGKVSISDAFKHSLNIVAVDLLNKVGFEEVISIANKLGVGKKKKLGRYYPLAIGAYEETVLNMTAAYAGITNRGIYIKPTPFEEIVGPSNAILWERKLHHQKGQKVLEENIADKLNVMLREAVTNGTGKAAVLKERQVAGKTGTSEGARDIWFIGSIPQLTTGVWFGHDNNQETKNSSGTAAWVWKQFMSKIEKDFPVINFPERVLGERSQTKSY
tara:strand:- start:14118 stop:15956 length:1839 start_codon:yes stop_codon:yes gene_type:complete